jgi:hypothetical protein
MEEKTASPAISVEVEIEELKSREAPAGSSSRLILVNLSN